MQHLISTFHLTSFLSPNLWFTNKIPWFITGQAFWFGILMCEKGFCQSLHLQSTMSNPGSVISCFDRYGKKILKRPSSTTKIPIYILFQCDVLELAVPTRSCQGRQLLWTGSTGWHSRHTAVWYLWWRSVGDLLHSQSSTTQLKIPNLTQVLIILNLIFNFVERKKFNLGKMWTSGFTHISLIFNIFLFTCIYSILSYQRRSV